MEAVEVVEVGGGGGVKEDWRRACAPAAPPPLRLFSWAIRESRSPRSSRAAP